MNLRMLGCVVGLLPVFPYLLAAGVAAQEQPPTPVNDSASFDSHGTAHITRVIPIPTTISSEAQKWLASLTQKDNGPETLEQRRAGTDAWRKRGSAEARKLFPVNVEETTIAGVRTDIITPLEMPEANRGRVLINLHGGGFNADSGSLIEGVPIANLAKIKVVSVYYRLAPENPFPAAVQDVVAVYKDLLKTYKPRNIGIFGTSAGASLTAETVAQLKKSRLPLPGAVGMFSIHPDYSRVADSQQMFSLGGFDGGLRPADPNHPPDDAYVGSTDRKDPILSPLFSDLKDWPASLLVAGTRDLLLSDTAMFHLALVKAGNDAQILVYEAMPHAFWYHFQMPRDSRSPRPDSEVF